MPEFPAVNGGGLTEQEVLAVTRANLNQVRHCYEQLLQRRPNASGKMSAKFVVGTNGRISSVHVVSDTLDETMMRGCVTGKIQRLAFPKPRNNLNPEAEVKFAFADVQPEAIGFNSQQVQVLVGGTALPQYVGKGSGPKLYIEAQEGKEYSIRVTNPFSTRVAVAVSVDGLNSIDASHTSADKAKKWIIDPYHSITVSGWQVASDRLRRFMLATEGTSYGSKLGKTNDQGIISVAMFRERTQTFRLGGVGSGKSLGLGGAGNFGSGSGGMLSGTGGSGGVSLKSNEKAAPRFAATAMGDSKENNIKFVSIDLESTPVMQTSIRYEYREVLEKLGIIPGQDLTAEDTLRRRERGQDRQVGLVPAWRSAGH